ncbi:MAG TPA: hypothetical protein VFT91_09890 [Dehalococcoidia bacterium]|nr:hypothetical protein [Dehalococcoidia bacterium]
MTRMSFLVATLTAGLAAIIITVAAACGGGGGEKTPAAATPTTTSTHKETPGAMASPASQAELETAFATARTQLQAVISKAQASDLKGARDGYTPADDPLHMIEDALRSKGNTSLADSIESKQHDGVEDPLKGGNPDLAAIALAAQDILPLLDQAASELGITAAAETPVSKAELTDDLAKIRSVLQQTIAKAQAGDVQGTRDAEGQGDDAIEAIIKAVRVVDPTLADQIEALELDYEHQADSDNPDLAVIAKDAQDVLLLLNQAAVKLGIGP